MSIRTGGATIPRRMFTTRSVPPPSGIAFGFSAHAAIASVSVVGLMMRNSGSASITGLRPRLRCADFSPSPVPVFLRLFGRPTALVDGLEDPVRGYGQVIEAKANRVGDGVSESGQKRCKRAFARFLRPEGAVRIVTFNDANFDRRGVLDGRYAVVEHVGGDHQPVVIGGFLAHGLAHAHPDRALHLAFNSQPIERLAAVMRDPDFVDSDDPGFLIDTDFHHLRRVAVTHGATNGRAAIFLATVRFRNG